MAFLRDKPGYLLRCHERYGETVRLSLGGPTLLITAPEDVRHVLVSAAGRYGKSPRLVSETARRRLGTSLFTVADADHARLRAHSIRCFHPQRLADRQWLLDRHCEEFAAAAVRHGTVDTDRHLAPFVAACIVEVLLGTDSARRRPGWSAALEERRRADEAAFAVVPLARIRSGSRRRSLSRLVAEAIVDGTDPDAILHGLLDDPDADAARTLAPGVEQILLAAYETTTMMLAWTIELLARAPDWMDRCGEESVAERVISEALRLYPPTWLFVRVATAMDRLPGGIAVPTGTKVYLSPYVSQRSSAAFVEAARFDPDRFLADRTVDPWRYFPFGAGTRSCLGERLARRLGATFLTALARRARLAPLNRHSPRPLGRVTLRPAHPIRVAVAERTGRVGR
ncbi:MAG: cytochrome P450 [Planctomycetes bacterium]|nr:cytochrome P450 [Planctomycetota bacterium]